MTAGHSFARWLALGSAVVFFGLLLMQALVLLSQHGGPFGHAAANKLRAAVVRNALEIGFNLWAFLSAKTARYFGVLAGGPNNRSSGP